ncbi:MAG: 1,4-alpha-glucan branching protein GlgB [Hahellaceae bacterium]|nr:1,4-alpha-glucan branching protein GlgB [Hahellaceae bacterium]
MPELKTLVEDLNKARVALPFDHLGCQARTQSYELRAWFPGAIQVRRLDWLNDHPSDLLASVGGSGLFTRQLDEVRFQPYLCRYEVTYPSGTYTKMDPYLLSELAFRDFAHDGATLYKNLGAHAVEIEFYGRTLRGVRFAVFAPHARSVSVVGDFNQWDGRLHPMGASGDGIWRLFLPEIEIGQAYKFEIHTQQGDSLPHKTDPFGFYIDQFPSFASRVFDHTAYEWQDEKWRQQPAVDLLTQPVNIYEVHLGSWRWHEGRPMSYRELADTLVPYVCRMGYTHIELLPVSEHPFTGSWGYQPVGLFASTSRFGSPDDFKFFVDCCHQAGIGVIMDWVPAHFPADGHGLANFDGTPLYEYPDPRKGWHPEWNSLIYDYGREHVCQYLISNAMFWLDYFHIDGLRVDAVASMLYLDYSRRAGEWIPNAEGGNHNLEAIAFLKRLNETLYLNHPRAVTIAEESTAFPGVSKPTFDGGLGFGFKWNMGWMNDTLSYMGRDHIYRRYHHNALTFGMMYAYSEHFILPISHDEVVHGKRSLVEKMPGDDWQRFANLRAFTGYQLTHPGKKLSFMGSEFGQYREWNYQQSLDWHLLDNPLNRGQQHFTEDLNQVYRNEPALWQKDYSSEGFTWLMADDDQNSVLGYVRYANDWRNHLIVLVNLTPVPRVGYRIGAPLAGTYRMILNSDDPRYGGSGYAVANTIHSDARPLHHQAQSLVLNIPPLACVILKPGI